MPHDESRTVSERPVPTDRECLGAYPSLETFVRATLEPLLPVGLRWLLDCLDLDRVLRAMTAGGRDHLWLEEGRIYLGRRPV